MPQHDVQLTDGEREQARRIIDITYAEDLGPAGIDVTAAAVVGHQLTADVIVRQAGVIAGLPIATEAFAARGITDVTWLATDGDQIAGGTIIGNVRGDAAALLTAERTVLNLLQQLSGVATLTRGFVDAARAGADAAAMAKSPAILDTRKTVPGMRALQRYAVRCGGGVNHRFGLFDAAMVKDNHVDLVGITAATEAIRAAHSDAQIVVEVRDLIELREALAASADIVLLDNMSDQQMREAVDITQGRALTEASGGITIHRVTSIAALGVDRISIGALTHSASALDIALDLHVASNKTAH